jgi:hypothetical protein
MILYIARKSIENIEILAMISYILNKMLKEFEKINKSLSEDLYEEAKYIY